MVFLGTLGPERERPNRTGKLPHPINHQIASTRLIRPMFTLFLPHNGPHVVLGSGAHCFSGLPQRVLVSIGQLLRSPDVVFLLREASPKPLARIHNKEPHELIPTIWPCFPREATLSGIRSRTCLVV